mmetsp:Transcript_21842/g.49752  ORF Transcript_21842/g.49752 Transcript_21842/m.49752 type:complete len:555 (-) Transcript_21842:130-1794(-)
MPRFLGIGLQALAIASLCYRVAAQQTLKLSSTLTIEKTDDKVKTHEQVSGLLAYAKEKKLEGNVVRFLENTVVQLQKVLDAAKIVEERQATEVPKEFTPGKYRVKSMPKLQAKKTNAKKTSAKELRERLQSGKDLNFDQPMLITNATSLFGEGGWEQVRRHWTAGRLSADEYLEQNLRVEYWPPDKARARLIGNMLQMEEPEMVAFSRYLVICFHGTPAKPKLPGQNTEHCEQTLPGLQMVRNSTELDALNIFPELKNALPVQSKFRERFLEAASGELTAMLGEKGAQKFKKSGPMMYQFFTFGPSGSGDKLHAENGLPFYDILIHGSRRWLLMKDDEMERVATKAKEALEFDKTSAYMFFEEKLPELKEEFGLKKYIEVNQEPGDLVIVPSGWYRVSLSLADSISYYEQILSEKSTLSLVTENNVWRPQFRQFQLAMCYDPSEVDSLPGVKANQQLKVWLVDALKKIKVDEALSGILNTLLVCGSVYSLDKPMPDMGVRSSGPCTKQVWKRCRHQLQEKLKVKGSAARLDWLPEDMPKSPDDMGAVPSKEGEL